jgi:hypothetical protein
MVGGGVGVQNDKVAGMRYEDSSVIVIVAEW